MCCLPVLKVHPPPSPPPKRGINAFKAGPNAALKASVSVSTYNKSRQAAEARHVQSQPVYCEGLPSSILTPRRRSRLSQSLIRSFQSCLPFPNCFQMAVQCLSGRTRQHPPPLRFASLQRELPQPLLHSRACQNLCYAKNAKRVSQLGGTMDINMAARSEERRVGKECVGMCRSRRRP